MTQRKQKLELTWIGKEVRPKLEPRILLEDPGRSHVAAARVKSSDIFDNRLIFGDNLLALKALEAEFTGKVKCVYIDPPYNTGNDNLQYPDGIEHSCWLGMMRDRLELLWRLLSPDGSLWVNLDDNEAHYAKVLLDEIFGRSNFVANVLWQKVYSERMDANQFSVSHDHILVYRRGDQFQANRLAMEQNDKQFNEFDREKGQYYRRRSLRKEGSNSLRADRPNLWYPILAPDGSEVYPIKPSGIEGNWRWSRETYESNSQRGLVEWVKTARNRWEIYVKQFKSEASMRPPNTWWTHNLAGHNHEAKDEARAFNGRSVFSTPKPERLLHHILTIATAPGDLVLDSFAGSGTTGAVAHKMGRRWIMVELGEHCHTHIIPRLMKVIDGQDPGGVTEATGWKGGGGFRYFKLAPSLLMQDTWGQWVISREYNAAMLAEALCKLEGFRYEPSDSIFWMQGRSTESDFLYCTTQTLSAEQLSLLSEEVGSHRTLLVLCSAFRGKADRWSNLTVKKIPKAVLHKCEWGHDDYSLKVENLPKPPKKKRTSLFDDEDGGDA